MRHSIDEGPYKRKEIPDPNNESKTIPEPISKMSTQNKNQYFVDIKVMNYILQGIPNDIYNSVDAFPDAQTMWARIRRFMHGESLTSVYERFATLINVMDQNGVHPQEISINTKLPNSLQPEWSKYVTMTRQKYVLKDALYDQLYDHLSQFEPHVNASKANKAARNHDPLALVANSNVHLSYSHASPSYSHSPQPYYVTYHSSVIDYEDDYQREIQGDAQKDKITTSMMLLARSITRRYSTPTNNRLRVQEGKIRIKQLMQEIKNVQCYNCNGKGHYAREFPKPTVRDAKYFREQMLLATKDEAGVHLDKEENDFMLDNAYGDNMLEELNAATIMMACIQSTDDKSDAKATYDAEFISEVNASQIDMINGLLLKSDQEQCHHGKLETIIHTSADDKIDSDIIFDDLYVDNNSGQAEHDTNAHDQSLHDFESLIYNVQKNEMLLFEKEKISNDSNDIQANFLKRIKILENNFQRSQAQSIDFELKLQHQKEKTACDISWKSKMAKLNGENVWLHFQIESLVQEREKIKLEYQKLFNSIKTTRVQHQHEVNELIENVSQKTHAYVDVRAKNQDLLMIISELKDKLKTIEKGKNVIQIVLWIVDSRCSKHMTGNLKLLRNFVEKFMGTFRFRNDHFAVITGYGDYVQVNLTICHVYYVKGLEHNLFSVGQFCDGDLEVAFRSNTCYVWHLEGEDLLTSSRDSNLYMISISEMAAFISSFLNVQIHVNKIMVMAPSTFTLNFGTINHLTKHYLLDGLPIFKYDKDHLCSACEQAKSKKATFQPKSVPSINSKLKLLHMDLYGPMRVETINGKRYILVIVDDYSSST
ncbi:hypothetical protein Tco_0446613 [Tanacetum coccineum]